MKSSKIGKNDMEVRKRLTGGGCEAALNRFMALSMSTVSI